MRKSHRKGPTGPTAPSPVPAARQVPCQYLYMPLARTVRCDLLSGFVSASTRGSLQPIILFYESDISLPFLLQVGKTPTKTLARYERKAMDMWNILARWGLLTPDVWNQSQLFLLNSLDPAWDLLCEVAPAPCSDSSEKQNHSDHWHWQQPLM